MSLPEAPASPPVGLRQRFVPFRGLLDFSAVVLAVYALWFTTPVGGLLQQTWSFVSGSKARTKPLVAYFRTSSASSELSPAVIKLVRRPAAGAPTEAMAKAHGLDPALARAVVTIAANGKTDPGGHFEVSLSEVGQASLMVVGKRWPSQGPAIERERTLIEGVALLSRRLASQEAAVAALAVELAQVRYAQDRARAAGAPHPDRFLGFGAYLPARARQEVSPLVNGTFALMIAYQLTWPVPLETRVSSPFGDRNHPVLGRQVMHKGVDLAVPTGTPIWAIAPGVVSIAGQDGINGRFVKLDHGHGLTSAYCHGSNLEVARGAEVKAGAVVLTSGASGRVSGPHLHFQLELDGVPIDPQLFFPINPP